MMSCASMVAFMPEPQTLLRWWRRSHPAIGAAGGLPRRRLALSGRQHEPMNTSSIRSGDSLARSTSRADHVGTELWALNGESSPMNRPSGVRAAETMTTGSEAAAMAGLLIFSGDGFLYMIDII